MQVASLHVYPVKGCAGVEVSSWVIEARGLRYDRQFMVVDGAGKFLTQRQLPALAVVTPSFSGPSDLLLTAPAGQVVVALGSQVTDSAPRAASMSVEIWGFRAPAEDVGDEAAELLSDHVGQTVRLVRVPADYPRRADAETAGPDVPVSFCDGYPLLITTTASLDALNGWLDEPLPMSRFRPNIVVEASTPWAEDGWRNLHVGEVEIELVSPCTRCAVTTIDQSTGVREGPEPLRSLAIFRRGPDGVEFGWNAVPRGVGMLNERDAVTVIP